MNESRQRGSYPKTTEALQRLNSLIQRGKEGTSYEEEDRDFGRVNSPYGENSEETCQFKEEGPTCHDKQLTRKNNRSRFNEIVRRYNNSNDRLGRGKGRGSRKVVRNPVQQVHRKLPVKKNRRNRQGYNQLEIRRGVPISEPFSFIKNFGEPSRSYKMNGEMVVLKGVEFLTSIVAKTATYSTPGAIGDLLYVLPVSPAFMAGTDLYKEAQVWEKFKWLRAVVRYVPTCPSTTNGALVAFTDCDIERPTFSIVTDGTVRLREALSRKESKEFHPFGQESFIIPNPIFDDVDWYDLMPGDEGDCAIPSIFNIMLASPVTDPNGSTTTMALGQLILEYECMFGDKGLIDAPTPTAQVTAVISATATNLFNGQVGAGSYVQFNSSYCGFSMPVNQVAVIRFAKRVYNTTSAGVLLVSHRQIPTSSTLGSQGTVLYGYSTNLTNTIFLTPNLQDAIMKSNAPMAFSVAVTGTDTITSEIVVDFFDMTLNL